VVSIAVFQRNILLASSGGDGGSMRSALLWDVRQCRVVILYASFHFLVSFEELKETVTQKWSKHPGTKYCV
jgi:hypothetical protein